MAVFILHISQLLVSHIASSLSPLSLPTRKLVAA